MKVVTVKWLQLKGACHWQVREFEMMFGKKAEVTVANLRKAARAPLQLRWLVLKMLRSMEDKQAYDAEYARVKARLSGDIYSDRWRKALQRVDRKWVLRLAGVGGARKTRRK